MKNPNHHKGQGFSRRRFIGGAMAMLAGARISEGAYIRNARNTPWSPSDKNGMPFLQGWEVSQSSDILIKNGLIATMDSRHSVYRKGHVYLKDGMIKAVGNDIDMDRALSQAQEKVEEIIDRFFHEHPDHEKTMGTEGVGHGINDRYGLNALYYLI